MLNVNLQSVPNFFQTLHFDRNNYSFEKIFVLKFAKNATKIGNLVINEIYIILILALSTGQVTARIKSEEFNTETPQIKIQYFFFIKNSGFHKKFFVY